MTTAQSEEVAVFADLGFCITCLRYRVYGVPCEVCGGVPEDRWQIEKEIEHELAQLLMATQHLADDEPDVHRLIDPRWRQNAAVGVDGPAVPAQEYISKGAPAKAAGPETIRGAIRVLRGIAATHGCLPEEMSLRPQDGREVVVTLDGAEWLCFENARTKALTRLRALPSSAPESESARSKR